MLNITKIIAKMSFFNSLKRILSDTEENFWILKNKAVSSKDSKAFRADFFSSFQNCSNLILLNLAQLMEVYLISI